MDPQLAIQLLTGALLASLGLNYYFGWWSNECRCASCQFHIHERRVVVEKAKREADVAAKQQADLQHNYAHKGQSFENDTPDRFNCTDDQCRRNKLVR